MAQIAMPPLPRVGRPRSAFPRLRLRRSSPDLLSLPWELRLADWPADAVRFRDLPVGPSRHLVRFHVTDEGLMVALKEEPLEIARREYDVLRHLEEDALPAVRAIGLAEDPEQDSAILVTEYLAHSLQYRRLLARFPLGPGPYRDRLLDAMAGLLVDLHRGGVYWGDCSLANTLFRRDGDKIAAYLVDAETSEIHPALSDGQRRFDLDVLVENVAFGLADLAALQGRMQDADEAIAAAEQVRERYELLWDELHTEVEVRADDRYAVTTRIRRLNELGFAVDEIELVPAEPEGRLRLRIAVTNRSFHARELERRTGIVALENQARLLLNDLREYQAAIECQQNITLSDEEGAQRWLVDVLEPSLRALEPVVGRRDPVQAYCDVLEMKWFESERAGRDVGLAAAIAAYLAAGAPAPESAATEPGPAASANGEGAIDVALDVDLLGGSDADRQTTDERVVADTEAVAPASSSR